uniref:Rab-GAP TBC domain-containing protein n=1 Tax=Chrysotila carterae TaxID=13221 RepID=A0A7S4FBJ3_CHRCT|mmetsp:Transcript_44025/g.91951  ORF Transcript_44025/g.91951 Transcript_44025/m.91951 type:complete len:313 (-) Transcript_44025:650-1588(-)|eukprot:6211081-Pleurochrysis_carterae.AAC.5
MSRSFESASESELAEVLESETHVDMEKLLSLCWHGIPDLMRGEAWKYLLGVTRPEKSEELSRSKRMEQEYSELERTLQVNPGPTSELVRCIKTEVKRYRPDEDFFCEARTQQRMERILRGYLHRHSTEFLPGMVHLLGPLVYVYHGNEADAYHCFYELMNRLGGGLTFAGCKRQTVTFMTLLRHTLPDLYQYLEEDQVAGGQWLTSWLQFLLARELPLPCVLRLWDSYFSLRYIVWQPSPAALSTFHPREASLQELHIFVCLAILEACHEELMELDDAELLWYLQHLPAMDMGKVITQAMNIKDDVVARSIL